MKKISTQTNDDFGTERFNEIIGLVLNLLDLKPFGSLCVLFTVL